MAQAKPCSFRGKGGGYWSCRSQEVVQWTVWVMVRLLASRPSESHLEMSLLILSVQGQGRALPNERISHHSRWRPGPLTRSEGWHWNCQFSHGDGFALFSVCVHGLLWLTVSHDRTSEDTGIPRATLSWYMRLATALATSEPMTKKTSRFPCKLKPGERVTQFLSSFVWAIKGGDKTLL